MSTDSHRFWTLGRISIALQLILIALVVVILSITVRTLAGQAEGFAAEAEERARQAEIAIERNREAIQAVTCILLISPAERTTENVRECGGVVPQLGNP